MNKNLKLQSQKGIAAIFTTVLVLMIMLVVTISLNVVTVGQQKISGNTVRSLQSYYAAESGTEDALLRLKKNPSMTSLSYGISVGGASTTVNIPEVIGGSRTITSQGNIVDRIRKVQAVYSINADIISFHYGAQIGDGGLIMSNNSRIIGNVFSNGSITGGNGSQIDNSVTIANNGNKIDGLIVGEDVLVHTCRNSTIGGTLTYVSGGSTSACTAKTVKTQPNQIAPEDMPISLAQIGDWKSEAGAGGIITNNVTYTNGAKKSLGPVQIGTPSQPRSLNISNNANLKLTGTVYVTGDINIYNGAIVELDANSYGSLSGVILADGKINVGNNSVFRGSGQTGSYILVLSTNNSLTSPAISVSNNAMGAIFYANVGLIGLYNNMKAREITGYKVQLYNGAQIQYESGLQNATFSSGPGGSWQVEDWRETE